MSPAASASPDPSADASSPPTATTAAARPATSGPWSPSEVSELAFRDQPREVAIDEVEVLGSLPPWLSGSLVRTGPARWDLAGGSAVNHWFDGLAMLHRFSIANGRVAYANRLLRGKAGSAYERTGKISFREFATDPCRTAFQRVASLFSPELTDNGNVNVGRLGDRWLAMTETPLAVVFDPETLETLGVEPRSPKLALPNAHPHYDHDSGEMIDLRVVLAPRAGYAVVARHPDGGERTLGTILTRRPGYQHSFGLTPGYVIISESPFVVNPLAVAASGKPFIDNFRWRPEQGSRLWAIDRSTGETRGPWTAPAMFCFHHVNAFEDDGAIVVDLLAYDDPEIVTALSLDRLRAGASTPFPMLQRYTLEPGTTTTTPVRLSDAPFELPRINGRHQGQRYDVVFGAGPSDASAFFAAVTKTTISDGATVTWQDEGSYAGEPVFVRRPDGTAEDDGVLLTVVLEPAREASSLVVLDAGDLRELARARVPHHIPFGFHGQFARATPGG